MYIKNSNITYDYYHIIENGLSNDRMEKMLRVYADEISFKDISVLSDF